MSDLTPPQGGDLRLILGLKLKTLRLARGRSLKEIAARAGLSISYLSELEKGKKYPKPEKLLQLARALGVPYDELVSPQVDRELGPLKEAVSSNLLREFPFELFGLDRKDLVRLISRAPEKSGALIRTLVDVGRSYDLQVEHFLLSALRSYQQMHLNHFDTLEQEAEAFRRQQGWRSTQPIDEASLATVLNRDWGYTLEQQTLAEHPDLARFRSLLVDGVRPTLYLNRLLLPMQKAFVLAREIGYRRLELQPRAATSPLLRIDSFSEVLNNFKASYFAGALLIDRGALGDELCRVFAREIWDGEAFRALLERFGATPEMFFYRLTELVPRLFGLKRLFFLRFHRRHGDHRVGLTKIFNLSGVPVPYGVGFKEHYCRRWSGLQLLARQAGEPASPSIAAQRCRFLEPEATFFVVSMSRQLVLDPAASASVSIGFLLDRQFQRTVAFWNDPAVPETEVHLTCERCPLSSRDCSERVAPATVHRSQEEQRQKEAAVAELLRGVPVGG